MNLRSLFLVLLWSTPLLAQSYVSRIIPDYTNLKKPPIRAVKVERTDSAIQFSFHSVRFRITQYGDLVQPLITARKNAAVAERELISASPFFPDAECRIVSFDADGNGVDDLFIVFPYGLTGMNSNVDVIAAFLFFPDSSWKFVNLRSYYGDTDLFRDYTRDGHYEYACINEVQSSTATYDVVNIFSIKDGVFTNTTRNVAGFPAFAEETDSGPVIIKELPPSVTGDWYLKKPDVLTSGKEAMN